MSHTIGKWVRFRIALVVIGLILLGPWICGRFFYLQVIKGPQLREVATREYQKFCPVLPVRGMIVDRKGLELAISTRVSSVVAHPLQIKHADRLSRELAPILGYKPRELKEILTRASSFVWVKRQLTPEREAAFQAWAAEADRKAKAAKVTGRRDTDAIYLIPEAKRYYPQLSLAGQVLGFCNIDGQGLEGVEHEFDKQLYGKPKQCWKTMDARGHIVTSGEKAWDPEVMGNNVVLTLDRTLQYIAEKELARGVEKYNAAGGTALVVQPQTGEILAMAQLPTMDPNRYSQFAENARRNRLVTDCLEPGSTYKIFVVASALDANVVKPGDRYNCESGHLAGRCQGSDPRRASLWESDGTAGHPKIEQYRRGQDRQQIGRHPPGSISPGVWLWQQKRHQSRGREQRAAEKSRQGPLHHRPGHRGLRPGGVGHAAAIDHGPGRHGQRRGLDGTSHRQGDR